MRAQGQQYKIPEIAVHSVICLCLFVAVFMFQYYFPIAYAYWVMEDLWGEYGTFVCFLLAGILTAWAIFIDRHFRTLGYGLLCLGLLFIAMEEISWGQRLFGLQTPQFFAQYNYQAEMTFHNFEVFRSAKLDIFYYAIGAWVFLLPIVSCFPPLKSFFSKLGIPRVPFELMPYFAVGLFVLKIYALKNSAEISEQFLGIAFLLYSFNIVHQADEASARPMLKKAYSSSVVIAAVALLTLLLVQIKPTEPRLKSFFLHQFAIKSFPDIGFDKQAEDIFTYLLGNKELKTDETMMQYGKFLQNIQDPRSSSVLQEALDEQREQARIGPTQSRPHYLAGKIMMLLGQNDEAKQEFETAIAVDRNNLPSAVSVWDKVQILKFMAINYLEIGQEDSALVELQTADAIVEHAWQKKEIKELIGKIQNK